MKDKLLHFIGLEKVRNIDILMDDLMDLTPAEFEYLVLSRKSSLPEMLERIHCDDCSAAHGGQCPKPFDPNTCVTSLADWLDQPAPEDRDTILLTEDARKELFEKEVS